MSITSLAARKLDLTTGGTPDIVGPGAYDPYIQIQRPRSAFSRAVPFGTTTRRQVFNVDEEHQVGPCSYEPLLSVRGKSAYYNFSQSSKRECFVDKTDTPGPADYSQLHLWVKESDKSLFSRQARKRDSERNLNSCVEPFITPGPTDYNTFVKSVKKGSSFGKSKSPQREPIKYNGFPGPCSYEVGSTTLNIKTGVSPAFRENVPGHISIVPVIHENETMAVHKAWCNVSQNRRPFGSGAIRDMKLSHLEETPSSASYTPVFKEIPRGQTKLGFGSSRIEVVNDSPGPGSYDIVQTPKQLIGNGKRCGRSDFWRLDTSPGPGQYELDYDKYVETKKMHRIKSPQFKDKTTRSSMVSNVQNPGPKYDTRECTSRNNKTSRKGFKIPKSDRFNDKIYAGSKMSDSPSPTDHYPSYNKKVVGGYIPKDVKHREDEDISPGPAKYAHQKSGLEKPSFNVRFNPKMVKPSHYRGNK